MANIKISQLPSWSGTAADLRWFVMNNSGETETFKFSGYTSQLKLGSGTSSIVPIAYLPSTNTGNYSSIVGGELNQISSNDSFIGGGYQNQVNGQFGATIGGQSNTSGFRSVIAGGYGNTANGNAAGVYTSENSSVNNGSIAAIIAAANSKIYGGNDQGFFIGGGDANVVASNGGRGLFVIGGSANRVQNFSGPSLAPRYNYGGILGGNSNYIGDNRTAGDGNTAGQNAYPLILGGYYNTITSFADPSTQSNWFPSIFNSSASTINGGVTGATISNSANSNIQGGTRNNIIGSTSSNINNSGSYPCSGVTMIGCVSTNIENTNNSVALGLTGKTINAGGDGNYIYMDKPYIFGNIVWDTTTVNESGTTNINVFTDAVTVINVTGGTYDLTITPVPNDPGTELTLMINYVAGTVNFVSSGLVQWKWGNGLGAPSFSANTRSIIKLATWAGNDLWEISRSMNMS